MAWFDVAFGAAYAGLGTVGYRQYNNVGGDAVARTTSGVQEVGRGAYGVEVTPDAAAVGIEWDTGGGSPIYAHQAITAAIDNDAIADALLDRADGIEAGAESMTPRQAARIVLSAAGGKANGLEGNTANYRDTNDTKNRITATVDKFGNRTAVSYDKT